MTKAQQKVLEDIKNQKDESSRMKEDKRIEWKIRGYITTIHYWVIAYNLPIALILWFVTDDFWKALGFLLYTQVYIFSANCRGLGLHVENYIEWVIKKTI